MQNYAFKTEQRGKCITMWPVVVMLSFMLLSLYPGNYFDNGNTQNIR